MSYNLFSDAAKDTALDAVGGTIMGSVETELLKQVFVAVGNGGGGGSSVSVVSDGTFSTAGTTTYSTANFFQRLYFTGSGGYIRKFVLSTSGRTNGDTISFLISVTEGSEAVVEVYNSTATGIPIFSYTAHPTDTGIARLDFIFNGTAWIASSPNEVFEITPETEPATLLFLEADSLAYSDGDPVALWASSSPGTVDAAEESTASYPPPTFKTSIVNSLPVVRFDSSSQEMLEIPLTNLDAYSILLVSKVAASPSLTLLGTSGGLQQALTFGAVGINPVTGGAGAFPASLYSYDGTSLTVPTTGDISDPSVSFRIYEYNRTASGEVTCKVNGVSVIGFTESGGGTVLGVNSIGNLNAATFFDGDVALLKVWDGVVPSGIMATQTASFATKYGIAI